MVFKPNGIYRPTEAAIKLWPQMWDETFTMTNTPAPGFEGGIPYFYTEQVYREGTLRPNVRYVFKLDQIILAEDPRNLSEIEWV